MARDQQVIRTLQNLPFSSLIGGPLSACIDAQAESALTCVNFIKEVGLEKDEDGEYSDKVVYVHFSFVQGGRRVNLSVPLLTIVPIPYIAINSIDINFTAKVCGTESSSYTRTTEFQKDEEIKTEQKRSGFFRFLAGPKKTQIKTQFSSKRSSKSTRDSSYSVESTIDVAVHAGQESMPAGMSKILEMLGNAIDTCSPYGELTVNDTVFYVKKGEKATVVAMYKSPMGVFEPDKIECKNSKGTINKAQGSTIFNMSADEYTITANEQSVKIHVIEEKA